MAKRKDVHANLNLSRGFYTFIVGSPMGFFVGEGFLILYLMKIKTLLEFTPILVGTLIGVAIMLIILNKWANRISWIIQGIFWGIGFRMLLIIYLKVRGKSWRPFTYDPETVEIISMTMSKISGHVSSAAMDLVSHIGGML